MTTNQALAVKLLLRGDSIEIRHGRLVIEAASGSPIPEDWMAENYDDILLTVLRAVGMEAFYYNGKSVGLHTVDESSGTKRFALTLHMGSVLTGEDSYVLFNVVTTRARTTKAGKEGSPLPRGQFRLKHAKGIKPTKHAFYQMWQSTDLKMPKMSAFHEYMGNLGDILFVAGRHSSVEGRLVASEMRALNLTPTQVKQAILTDKPPTNHRQATDKPPTNVTDKEITETHARQGDQPDSTTEQNNYSNKVIRKCDPKGSIPPIYTPHIGGGAAKDIRPDDPGIAEWLDSPARFRH